MTNAPRASRSVIKTNSRLMRYTFDPPEAVLSVRQGGKLLPIIDGAIVFDPRAGELVFNNACEVNVTSADLDVDQ
jgi:hypothetical protein